jgi:hypothetical protein
MNKQWNNWWFKDVLNVRHQFKRKKDAIIWHVFNVDFNFVGFVELDIQECIMIQIIVLVVQV